MLSQKTIALSLCFGLLTSVARAHAEFQEISVFDMYDAIPSQYLSHPTAQKWNAFLNKAKAGGTLSIGTDPLIRTLEPYDFVNKIPGPKRVVFVDDLVYETLMMSDVRATENNIVRPHIAQRIELDPDSQMLRFEINPAVRFSDGTPVKNDDLVKSWLVFKEAIPSLVSADLFEGDVNVSKSDDGKIMVKFATQDKALFRRAAFVFLSYLRILKENPDSNQGMDTNLIKQRYIGTGPYVITYANRYKITMVKTTHYWAKGNPEVKGLFNFDTVNVIAFADPDNTRQGITSSLTNFHREGNPAHFEELEGVAKIKGTYREEIQDINYTIQDGSARALFMNTQSDFLRDVNLRRALIQAWDPPTAEHLFNDLRVTPSSPSALSPLRPRGNPTDGAKRILEASRDPLKAEALKPYEDMGYELAAKVTGARNRLKEAMKMLSDSGYSIQSVWGTPTLLRNGRPVELKIISIRDRPDNRRVMLFAELLKKMGINVEFRLFPDLPQFQRALNKGLYDLAPASLSLHRDFRVLNLVYLRQSFHSDGIKSGLNRSRLSSPAIDEALTKLKKLSPRQTEYKTYLEVFFRSLSAQAPFILLGEPVQSHIFIDPNLCVFPEVPSEELPKNLLSVKTGYFGCQN